MWVEHVLKTKWPSSVMEPHSNLCQLPAEIAVWFHRSLCFFYASDHWPASLVSVLCKSVSSIPTSLSFLKVFILVSVLLHVLTVHQLNYSGA